MVARALPSRAFFASVLLSALGLSLLVACQKSSQEKQSAPATGSKDPSDSAPAPLETSLVAEESAPAPKDAPTSPDRGPQAQEPQQRRTYVVAALGDSITDARSGGGGFLKVLRKACPQSQFLNFGKGGDMTNQMRRRFEQEILPRVGIDGINTLLVYGGVNDLYSDLTAGRTNDRIEGDLSSIYRSAQEKGLLVVAVTVSPWGGFTKYYNARRGQNTRLLNSWILGQVARGPVDRAVDSFAPLSCGDPDRLCPAYETNGHDGLHPGVKGHEILGQKLLEEAFPDCL
jgi:hypothetical protein